MQQNQREMQLIKLFYNKIEFNRIGFLEKEDETEPEQTIDQRVEVNKEINQLYKITLTLHCEKKEEFKVEIELCGVFFIMANTEEDVNVYLNNAVAIMMPYLRNQLTILTSQPDMKPIVMSVVNFKNSDLKDED